MEITVRKEGNASVVSVKGRIDAVTAGEFEKGNHKKMMNDE